MKKNTKSNKNNYFKIASLVILLSVTLTFTIEVIAKKDYGFIEWKSIPAASGYRVEIKKNDKIVLEKNVNENIYYVDLPKGEYEFRIGVLNIFKKPAVWSFWNPLKIIISKVPVLDENSLELKAGDKAELNGNNFLENTKLTLVQEGKNVPIQTTVINENKISFETKNLKPGTYDLVLENPNGKKLEKESYLVLIDPKKFIPKKAPDKEIKRKDIAITSESLEKADITVEEDTDGKTTVNIGPHSKDKLDITLENKSTEKVTVDINNRSAGKVNFNVENKSKIPMDLNVKNLSKSKMAIGIIEKSKGKVEVKVSEKSKDKVDISTIFAEIETFDVTIENKTKERFDINIGKALIKRTPEKKIEKEGFNLSSDSLNKADISVDESIAGKMSLNIGPDSKEDLEISLENKSKEDVTVDINNRAEGKVSFNVENKSKEKLALNIKNNSKKPMNVGIIDTSDGKVEVEVSKESTSQVDIKEIELEVDNFDVTIENKSKKRFDINIGKKEVPPLVFKPSNETFPANYERYSLAEFQSFASKLQRTCSSNLDVPDILIDQCHSKHVSLNLGDKDRKILYNFIKLESGNYISRITAFKYFIQNCNPSLRFISDLAENRMKTVTQDENEKFFQKKTIESFNTCSIKE